MWVGDAMVTWEVLETSGLTGLLGLCRLVTVSCAVMWECCNHRLTVQEGQVLGLPEAGTAGEAALGLGREGIRPNMA